MRAPGWKNAVVFLLYPVIGFVMAVCCLIVLLAAWPISLFVDFDAAEASTKEDA